MFQTGNVTTKTQFKVAKKATTAGSHPRPDMLFNGTAFAHVIELKQVGTSLEDAVEQVQGYAGSERLQNVLDVWKKPGLFWVVYFDASHLGEKEDVADVRQIKIWVEGPYETDEDGKVQVGQSKKEK